MIQSKTDNIFRSISKVNNHKVFRWVLGSLFLLFSLVEANGQITRRKDVLNDTIVTPYLYINKIHILGNRKTKREIITRELSFDEGDSVMTHWLERFRTEDRNKVYNTNLFNTVDFTILELDSVKRDILITVTERWYLYPGVIFKLSDRNFNDWWVNREHDFNRVNFGGRLYKYNFRGRKEALRLTAQFGFETLLLLNYEIPYIEKSQKHGLTFDLGYAENKNLAYQTYDHLPKYQMGRSLLRQAGAASVTYTYRKSFYTKHYATIGFKTSHISDTIATLNREYFANGATDQQYLRMGYSFRRDYRDNHNYPLKGDLIFASVDRTGFGFLDDLNRWRVRASYDKYVDLSKGFYFSTELSGVYSSSDVPYDNYLALGYLNNLVRGYELDLIEGPINVLAKNNLRKRIFKTATDISKFMPVKQFQRLPLALYGKVFFDAGYVHNYPNHPTSKELTDKLLYGVGVGLDFVTIHDISWRMEYSYNAEGEFNFFLNFKQDL